MLSEPPFESHQSDEAKSWLDAILNSFDAVWRNSPRPKIEAFLPEDRNRRQEALVELIHRDLELRLKTGEAVRVERYLESYPDLARDPLVVPALLLAEYRC